jgi:hypothetical protein
VKWFFGAVVCGILLLGCSNSSNTPTAQPTSSTTAPTSTPTASKTTTFGNLVPTTTPLTDLVLTVRDMPVGWVAQGQDTENSGDFKGYFRSTLAQSSPVKALVTEVRLLPTVEDAQNEYVRLLQASQQRYSISKQNIGDQAFAYASTGFAVIVQRKNVVGVVLMSTALYGGSLDETVQWARTWVTKVP